MNFTRQGLLLNGCRHGADQAVIEIIDCRAGNADLLSAFRQANPRSDGRGLGLWSVSRTAETLGCPVTMRPIKGHDSRFSVSVPRA